MKYDSIKKEYTSIKKSWNSDVSGTINFAVFDINKDGYPDMYLGGLKKGNTFINSGEQDCDFEYFSKTYTGLPEDSYMTYDIDNDGNFDLVSGDLYYNSGNGYTFNKKYINSSKFFDFNRDGAWDYEYYKSFYYDTRVKLNKNKELGADFGEERVFCKDRVSGFADFNNDGYLDGYYYNNTALN